MPPEFLDLIMPPYISKVIYETQVTEFPTSFPTEDWKLEQHAWVSHGVILAAFTNSDSDGGVMLMLYDAMEQNPRLLHIESCIMRNGNSASGTNLLLRSHVIK